MIVTMKDILSPQAKLITSESIFVRKETKYLLFILTHIRELLGLIVKLNLVVEICYLKYTQ